MVRAPADPYTSDVTASPVVAMYRVTSLATAVAMCWVIRTTLHTWSELWVLAIHDTEGTESFNEGDAHNVAGRIQWLLGIIVFGYR